MKEYCQPIEIHQTVVEFIEAGRSFVLATVLEADGSTPQKVGIKAVIDNTGKIFGTLGGGQIEAKTQKLAIDVCKSKHPLIFDMNFDGACAKAETPICGGAMRILIDPTIAKNRAAYGEAAEALKKRHKGLLLTTVHLSENPEVNIEWVPVENPSAEMGFPCAEALRWCLEREKAKLFLNEETSCEILVEPIIPQPLLLIAGGGHIGQALTLQAVQLGFEVVVIDDRPEFTKADLFPEGVTTRCGEIAKELSSFDIAGDTYIVIVTRGHKHDADALAACIQSRAAYIGMIGSKRKVTLIRENFIESGLSTEEELGRVFAPVGLNIGAVTVPEIATSIAAQLTAVRRKGDDYTAPGDMVLR